MGLVKNAIQKKKKKKLKKRNSKRLFIYTIVHHKIKTKGSTLILNRIYDRKRYINVLTYF